MAYQEHDQNSFCFSVLASFLKASYKYAVANEISIRTNYSLEDAILDRIEIANENMTDESRKKGERHLLYKLLQWN